MEVKTILIIVIIIVLLYIIYKYIVQDKNTLSGFVSAKTMQKVDPSSLENSTSTGSSNFTYSIWFFVDDWNYRYGEPKIIFGRMTDGATEKQPCPSATLGALENNLIISMSVYPGLDEVPESGSDSIVHTVSVANVPIQKWCNLLISTYNRTLDIYLDGKLVRTSVLPGVAKVDSSAPVYITPLGGFSGYTDNFQFWADSCDPQKAWNIYQKGYGGNWLSNLFGKYSVKVTVMENDVENSSFTL
jgi:hypothetical protein